MARIKVIHRAGVDGPVSELESSPAVSILNSLLIAGVRIRHDCGGKALCGTCAIRVLSGWTSLSPMGPREAERLAAGGRPADFRLACQSRAAREVSIEIAADGPADGGET
ncbi:MAG: 2Fe-2S iron-sulfur cluster-binding protein [Rectinemataceae bacterium]